MYVKDVDGGPLLWHDPRNTALVVMIAKFNARRAVCEKLIERDHRLKARPYLFLTQPYCVVALVAFFLPGTVLLVLGYETWGYALLASGAILGATVELTLAMQQMWLRRKLPIMLKTVSWLYYHSTMANSEPAWVELDTSLRRHYGVSIAYIVTTPALHHATAPVLTDYLDEVAHPREQLRRGEDAELPKEEALQEIRAAAQEYTRKIMLKLYDLRIDE